MNEMEILDRNWWRTYHITSNYASFQIHHVTKEEDIYQYEFEVNLAFFFAFLIKNPQFFPWIICNIDHFPFCIYQKYTQNYKQEFLLEAMSNSFLIIFIVISVISCAKAENVSEHHQCQKDCSFTAWECYDSK